ncbi:MAG: aminotransferase class III-fold pyridoxal phosphate-dependent enzyme, partial [Planctomycetota bacterium]
YTEQVAAALSELTCQEAVFFSNSGAEANECALKLARAYQKRRGEPQRTGFLAFEHGFHGRTLGTISVTANPKYREPFEPLVPGATFLEPGDPDAVERALTEQQPAAVILEPIQGEGGIRELDHDFLRAVRALCTQTGTVLIHDEVQGGCGRTGTFLAGAHARIAPDIVTLAKPLGCGVPIGATCVAPHLAEVLVPGDHGTTFGGGPLALRAALTFLELWREGELAANVEARGAQLAAGLDALAERFDPVLERRGRGLMQGLALAPSIQAGDVVAALHRRRVLTCPAGQNVLRFLPPYVVTEADIDLGLERVADALEETFSLVSQ